MSYQPAQAGIGALPRGAVGWRLTRIRAVLRRRRLDAALAQGADPWSAGELLVRAAQLGSPAERRKVAAGLTALLDLAAFQRRGSPYLTVRHELVIEHQESLRALAERLDQSEPVDVAVVAQLELLLTDPASPVYTRRGRSSPARRGDGALSGSSRGGRVIRGRAAALSRCSSRSQRRIDQRRCIRSAGRPDPHDESSRGDPVAQAFMSRQFCSVSKVRRRADRRLDAHLAPAFTAFNEIIPGNASDANARRRRHRDRRRRGRSAVTLAVRPPDGRGVGGHGRVRTPAPLSSRHARGRAARQLDASSALRSRRAPCA